MGLKLIYRIKLFVETDVGTPRSGRSVMETGEKATYRRTAWRMRLTSLREEV